MPTPLDIKQRVHKPQARSGYSRPSKHDPDVLIDDPGHPDMRKLQQWFSKLYKDGELPLAVHHVIRKTRVVRAPLNHDKVLREEQWLVIWLFVPEEMTHRSTQVLSYYGGVVINLEEERAREVILSKVGSLSDRDGMRYLLGSIPQIDWRFYREKEARDNARLLSWEKR